MRLILLASLLVSACATTDLGGQGSSQLERVLGVEGQGLSPAQLARLKANRGQSSSER